MGKMKQLGRDLQFLTYFTGLALCIGCAPNVEYKVSVANPLDGEEAALVARVNQERTKVGLAGVNVCASLNVATSTHSDDMRDNDYLSDVAPNDSKPPTRACDAGYAPACGGTAAMVELIAKGHVDGASTFAQWSEDPASNVMFTKPEWVVVGVGRSLDESVSIWTVDFADKTDSSCQE